MKPYEIAIFFSGLERSLASSKFNMRVDEARSAAYSLMALAGMDYGKFEETNLRDVPYEVYLKYKDKLPVNFAKRAEHWYTEFQRVVGATLKNLVGSPLQAERAASRIGKPDLQS